MNKTTSILVFFLLTILSLSCSPEESIDRNTLVSRHNVLNTNFDTLNSLTVGNGGFAYTVDFTGLQTFPEEYSRGIPLGTQSDWGWHSFPNTQDYRIEETMEDYDVHGKEISYSVHVETPLRGKGAVEYFRVNPHRLHLGIIGFNILSEDGQEIPPEEFTEISQELDLWKGEIRSSFKVMDELVEVVTVSHPELDVISFRAKSKLISSGQMKIKLQFPYPSGEHSDMACDWDNPELHYSQLRIAEKQNALIKRTLDTTQYYTRLEWDGELHIGTTGTHSFELASTSDSFNVSIEFSPTLPMLPLPTFDSTRSFSNRSWTDFWMSGGAVDFTGSKDPRAHELERRIVLSQYLTRVQCAGSHPPQETGLTYNSWYGKFHLEMAWWHMVHFYLWNRSELMEENMAWYKTAAKKAEKTAMRQGYEGVRWQKMTDPYGNDSPSSTGSFLIWQQPHFIYFAELYYRQHKDLATLNRYKDLVFATADFMASYPWYNPEKERYELGPALIPAQECFDPQVTINPPFELAYWYWGLNTAIQWSHRLGLTPDPKWKKVMDGLSPLFANEGLYPPAESVPLAYKEGTHMHDHPAVLGAYGAMPGSPLLDIETMRKTFDYVWENWQWEETWGWDFPLTAMTAVRMGEPEKAMDALFMQPETNTYLKNGHNYQNGRLRLYLPGNGGLLSAVAMMCAGYDGCKTINPGIPDNGQWNVRWEELSPIP